MTYEADDKGFRAKGEYLLPPLISNAVVISSAPKDSVATISQAKDAIPEVVLTESVDLEMKSIAPNDFLDRKLEIGDESKEEEATAELIPERYSLIQVPLISKVLSLTNSNRPVKPRSSKKSAKKSQQIIRYRLAFQPSFNSFRPTADNATKLKQID